MISEIAYISKNLINQRLREIKQERDLVTIFLFLFLLPTPPTLHEEGRVKVVLDVFEMISCYPTEINDNTANTV